MNLPPGRLQGDVDTPRPIRAAGGRLMLEGWCFISGVAVPPAVRLVTGEIILPMTARQARPDLARLWADEPVARESGFSLSGWLPAGVHLARLEAKGPDGRWQGFKNLCIAAEARPFAAGLDSPAATKPVTERVHVEGWALDPRQPLHELTLRYGHQEITCELDRPRTDVPEVYPETPHAARSGFKSKVILSAGHGALRLRARLADGTTAIARTGLEVMIDQDENHGPGLDLTAARIPLPGPVVQTQPPGQRVAPPLNILFILPGSFAANSAFHVAALANELATAGHACAVAVAHDPATLSHHCAPAFRGLTYQEAVQPGIFPDGRGPDVIHAWTTRENVRQLACALRLRHSARCLVHLEDNEPHLLALTLDRTPAELAALPDATLDRMIPADLSHPRRSLEFLATADGVTVITERLREFVPAGRPVLTLWPAADARYFAPMPVPAAFRAALALTPGTTVLFYHGNVHAANAADMRELYAAVARLNETGHPVTLIRTGLDQVDFLGPWAGRVQRHVIALGQILQHRHLPPLMALADIFVQPGAGDAFNAYRFPSKLPEFFAIGRPVILPRTNLGERVRHGVDAYVLERADAAGIARAVLELRADPALQERLGRGAIEFAARHFSWRRSAAALANFYTTLAPS